MDQRSSNRNLPEIRLKGFLCQGTNFFLRKNQPEVSILRLHSVSLNAVCGFVGKFIFFVAQSQEVCLACLKKVSVISIFLSVSK